MPIVYRQTTSKRHILLVESSDTVAVLRQKIAKVTGLPADFPHLMFAGTHLNNDNKQLWDYNVMRGNEISQCSPPRYAMYQDLFKAETANNGMSHSEVNEILHAISTTVALKVIILTFKPLKQIPRCRNESLESSYITSKIMQLSSLS
jgi:hypothetical protein